MSKADERAGAAPAPAARARADFERVRERLPEPLFALLPRLLEQSPDPEGALNALERFTAAAGARVLGALARQPALLQYLVALFSHSRFLSATLLQQPDLILWLGRDRQLARLKPKEDLLEECARFETASLAGESALALVRFKHREYLRIALRDLLGLAGLGETTLELSLLADVLLERALATASQALRARYGTPETTDAGGRRVPARFAVISLGKLGGRELNYSSDIDLMFLYAGDGETRGGPEQVTNREYFLRLAQRYLDVVAGLTPEGALFRVDLRLRPSGAEGDLAPPLAGALDYYERRAAEWERQMLLKARHSAGDAALVREFLRGVEPCLYGGAADFAAVDAVLRTRERMDRKLSRRADTGVNVKLSPGGIRDIEFLAQCLQRLHGQNDPWVRVGGTLAGLQRLADKSYLVARDHARLAAAYEFLRRVEHRLQLDAGQQTHSVPDDKEARALLAQRLGAVPEEFDRQLAEQMAGVRQTYERLLRRAPAEWPPEEFALRPPRAVTAGEDSFAALVVWLRDAGSPLAAELERLEAPRHARATLHRFLSACVSSSRGYEAACRAAAGLPAALDLLCLSRPLGEILIREPERLETLAHWPVAGPLPSAQAQFPLTEAAEPAWGATITCPQAVDLRERMNALRRQFRDDVFRWGAAEVLAGRGVEAGLRGYTRLAEEVLRECLAVAAAEAAPASIPKRTGLAVIALGRLATREMALGSDADLVFVAADATAQAAALPAVEKFLHVVSAYTREGTLFPVDTRLRPQGGEGELVQTAAAMREYFATRAEVWEAATYLKARPVAGERALGERCVEEARTLLRERFRERGEVCQALAAMRQRLEAETGGEDNFKSGVGGFYDIEFVAAQAALVGQELGTEDSARLEEAARFFRAVDHAVRLATGRASARLPAGRRAEAVAELVSRWLGQPLTAGGLAARLAVSRREVRALYARVFG